jgi:hypothetical protein
MARSTWRGSCSATAVVSERARSRSPSRPTRHSPSRPRPSRWRWSVCAGDCADWQGLAHSNEHPSLAIGKGTNSGKVYRSWADGDRQAPDTLTTTGFYNFTDVKFSQSADGGMTWSPSVRVNNNSQGGSVPPTDHFEPALATDLKGRSQSVSMIAETILPIFVSIANAPPRMTAGTGLTAELRRCPFLGS